MAGQVKGSAVPSRPHVTRLTAGSVSLAWPPIRGAARYQVFRDGRRIATVSGLTYIDRHVRAGRRYRYALRSVDRHGRRSRPSRALSVAVPLPPDRRAPGVPGSLRASLFAGKAVRLTWKAATDDHRVVAYDVFRDGRLIASLSGRAYADYALAPGTTYAYAVAARDA